MEGIYDIFQGTEKIGKAEVRKEGLYYRVRCCCNLTGAVIYRLTVTSGSQTENLGIPVPDGDAFYLQTRLPVSRFVNAEPEFRAVPKHTPVQEQGKWLPVSPEEPFDYIHRLENAVMEQRDGIRGILIQEAQVEVPQDSDQNPSHQNG